MMAKNNEKAGATTATGKPRKPPRSTAMQRKEILEKQKKEDQELEQQKEQQDQKEEQVEQEIKTAPDSENETKTDSVTEITNQAEDKQQVEGESSQEKDPLELEDSQQIETSIKKETDATQQPENSDHLDGEMTLDEFEEEMNNKHDHGVVEGQVAMDDQGSLKTESNQPPAEIKIEPFSRKTKIEKVTSNVSIKSLFKEWKKDQTIKAQRKAMEEEAISKGEPVPDIEDETTLRFDLAIQRNETWTDYQKSDLIHTVLYGYYIPPVLVQDSNDGKKWFLDGKQRMTTLMSFIEGSWALSKKTKPVYGHVIANMKFKDLPEEMQDEILDETITLVHMKNMTIEERDEMFVKQNSGAPLSRIELIRAMYSALIDPVNEISKLPFFKDDVGLSAKARNRFGDTEIILQIAMLLEEGIEKIKGFGAGHIEEYVLNLKKSDETISDELMQKFEDISAYLSLAFEDFTLDETKKTLKKVHVPIIFYNAQKAMEQKTQPKLFGEFIRSFLITNYSVESEYGESCQSGVTKKEGIKIRIYHMSKSLEYFLNLMKNAPSTEKGVEVFNSYLGNLNGIVKNEEEKEVETE